MKLSELQKHIGATVTVSTTCILILLWIMGLFDESNTKATKMINAAKAEIRAEMDFRSEARTKREDLRDKLLLEKIGAVDSRISGVDRKMDILINGLIKP